ncbi:hypothetical protein K437DRAFT_166477 [Tilletiaria anomala UBC 951]|uniref:Uncharacterized protein n=1 Tax=Tilletiaria anomala (strain ATCC 24038 / CBS 436.72 / UBC 951) TaxID=1037660 RepID=A0A066VPH5_TILAU|nr:uncharacterized protein K437DRAFT_166477 [Tilletiaria anomala UBC 951]KDN42193.1 hypothetical protein K437DRAFT_166477 [Tilletiaria anomala UBC 951]
MLMPRAFVPSARRKRIKLVPEKHRHTRVCTQVQLPKRRAVFVYIDHHARRRSLFARLSLPHLRRFDSPARLSSLSLSLSPLGQVYIPLNIGLFAVAKLLLQ